MLCQVSFALKNNNNNNDNNNNKKKNIVCYATLLLSGVRVKQYVFNCSDSAPRVRLL